MKLSLRDIVLLMILWLSVPAVGQTIKLKNRSFVAETNIRSFNFSSLTERSAQFEGKAFVVLQFSKTVSEAEKQGLKQIGVELQHYVPDNAFTAVISRPLAAEMLEVFGANFIYQLCATDKLSSRLAEKRIPDWAIKQEGKVDVIVHFNPAVSVSLVKDYFIQQGYSIVEDVWQQYHFISVRVDREEIEQLASIPFVEYVEPVAPDPKIFDMVANANTRANVLNADPAAGGEGLKGAGVTIGIGDNADPASHVDLKDRLINRAAGTQDIHGTHVAGIAAGGGLKDPMFPGVAPLATIVAQLFNGIFLNAAAYINDYHMVITNNSWGNITGECDLSGVYDSYSKLMDDLAIQYPYLLNIFAAGNDGRNTCLGYPKQYHTIVSGHQSAKNVLSVAWGEMNATVAANSSVGPTADGRIKPEITSQGSSVRSTAPGNTYFTDWGTSMAAPTVAGGAALLIEKYRQLNAGADPKSGLVKALLINGSRDIENPAPDYRSGYGFMNLVRSLDMLKNNRYLTSTVTTGAANNHDIIVPAGLAQLKVMVYWNDPSAAPFVQNTLVNDIDLELVASSGSTVLPWTLNPTNTAVTANAVRGADHINNAEQVTIDNPTAGTYTIKVKGTAINEGGSQEYFVVYDYVPTGVDLTFPSVAEPLVPGEEIIISWDSWGDPQNTFTLQYSVDGGLNWINIDVNIDANARQYIWTVPNFPTDKAKLRLLKNGTAFSDESLPFAIVNQPAVSLASVQCEDYISINWNAVAGATDYEVMMKQGPVMVSVATTASTNYIFSGLNRDRTYWVTVRARINGKAGRRAIAISRKPDNGTCAGSISDNDLKIDSILSPASGRKFTSTEITSNNLSIRIKNLDDAPVTGFTVKYSINGSSYISNNVSATIPANGTYVHSFTGLNFSAAGDYKIIAVVKNNAVDANSSNDTAITTMRQLSNPPITLPYTENFDTAPSFEIIKDTMGLPSLDKWDFINLTDFGRVRSFVNTGIAKSGNRALTLDVVQYTPPGNTNYLIGTFNLSSYNAVSSADLGLILEFSYKHHGKTPHTDNRVWVRRSDTDQWVEIFSFDSIPLRAGEWKTVSINLSPFTALANPTSSFQIRFGQRSRFMMGDNTSTEGLSIDDVKLFSNPKDIQLISIESPIEHSCSIGSGTSVTIKFADYRGISGCIPIKYRINGGAIISECAVSSGTLNTFTFTSKLNLASFGTYVLEVWSDLSSDTYRNNDTLRLNITNNPIVTTYPYYENFENGTGYWHAEGYKSSWQYGTPASLKINKAASGTKAWKTTLRGQYNEGEQSYLYSPCYDISSLKSPYLSFDIAIDLEQCGQFLCDQLWVEYSSDGKTWTKLGAYGQGVNWYNKTQNVWDTANYTNWHAASIALPTGLNKMQLRFVLFSDESVTREGVAIDNIQIFDQQQNIADVQWRLYPNPAVNAISLLTTHTAGKTVSINLYNAAGQLVHQQTFTATGFFDNTTLNLGNLSKGVYALKVTDGSKTKVFRFVKQ